MFAAVITFHFPHKFPFLPIHKEKQKEEEEVRKALKDVLVILSKLVKILLEMKIFITLSSNSLTRRETKRRAKGGKILIKTFSPQ